MVRKPIIFETVRTSSTMMPPIMAVGPGFSPNTYHTKIGAKMLSKTRNKPTSAEVIYLGPIAIRQVASGSSAPPKINIFGQSAGSKVYEATKGVTAIAATK